MDLKPSLYKTIMIQIEIQLGHSSVMFNNICNLAGKICKNYRAVIAKTRFHLPAPASIIDSETMFKSGKKLVKGISNQEKE
jgi:hypothetical protein